MPGALGQNQNQLFNRIKRILNQSTMKTNIREKLFSILLMAGGVIILLTISGFSSGFSIVKHNDSKQEASIQSVTSQLVQAPIPIMGQDTIPLPDPDAPEKIEQAELEKEIEVAKMEPMKVLEEVNWEEIKKEMELAQQEAIESIDWEELKKEMEVAKQQAMESIDWEELKLDLAETRIHVDSIMQDFDFDFDLDIDMEDIKVEMEEAMRELEEVDWEEIRTEMEEAMKEFEEVDWEEIRTEMEEARKELEEVDWEEIRTEMENVRIQLDSVHHSN